jgi:hypothetical protein
MATARVVNNRVADNDERYFMDVSSPELETRGGDLH